MKKILALGLMSGTSLDGVDAALIETDGHRIYRTLGGMMLPMPPLLQERIRRLFTDPSDILSVEAALTELHAEAAHALLARLQVDLQEVAVAGFHGQTIQHRPVEGMTWQIGNPSLLAERMGIDVVADFRRRDMAAGGQGAPLVPIFHEALTQGMPRPLVVLNIGGVANVTWIGETNEANNSGRPLLAFDTGPGNALMNDVTQQMQGAAYDPDGAWAAQGVVDHAMVADWCRSDYFHRPPPKSLDRNQWDVSCLVRLPRMEDRLATLAAFTIETILAAAVHFPAPPAQWVVCGGGANNRHLMQNLQERCGPVPVSLASAFGWDGDLLEAEAFAFLAVRSLYRLPLTFPGTTGVRAAVTGGGLYRGPSVFFA